MDNTQYLRDLIKKKDQTEAEIAILHEQCETMDRSKNLSKNLLDSQGFPRPDLNYGDLLEYRTTKRRLQQLKNDHLALMKQIEKNLYALHALYLNDPSIQENKKNQAKQNIIYENTPIQNSKKLQQKYEIEYLTPFAKISLVQPQSPAFIGGLRADDYLSQIGEVNVYTPDTIKSIPQVVKQGTPLKIVVMRRAQQLAESKIFKVRGEDRTKIICEIIPRKWSGRGILGCKIDPF